MQIIVLAMAVTFSAFVVWLVIRFVNRRTPLALLLTPRRMTAIGLNLLFLGTAAFYGAEFIEQCLDSVADAEFAGQYDSAAYMRLLELSSHIRDIQESTGKVLQLIGGAVCCIGITRWLWDDPKATAAHMPPVEPQDSKSAGS
jgi:hypothetical protein